MGMFAAVQKLIQDEHAFRPIKGDILLIGRQIIEETNLTDVEFFASFCKAKVRALDVSDFEGAEIIHDLCAPLPAHLHSIADFIFDGSCLDNIWDPPQALRSMSAMLRPGGRMVLFDHGTMIKGAFTVFSPEWFWDFFAVNNYADCQVTVGWIPPGGLKKHWMRGPWHLEPWWAFKPDGNAPMSHPKRDGNFVNVVLAEKGETSTDHISPVQAQYRRQHVASGAAYAEAGGPESDVYRQAWARYSTSKRRK